MSASVTLLHSIAAVQTRHPPVTPRVCGLWPEGWYKRAQDLILINHYPSHPILKKASANYSTSKYVLLETEFDTLYW